MEFKPTQPISAQIADALCARVLAGAWNAGQRISSIREMAAEMQVNPNTIARSYSLLEEAGVIRNERGIGYFVCDQAQSVILERQRQEFLQHQVPELFQRMALLKIAPEELLQRYRAFLARQKKPLAGTPASLPAE